MTSLQIQRALCGYWHTCLWNPRKVTAVRNSTGVAGWDADLLVIQPSGWADEVEIKVSTSDFKREFEKKSRKHRILIEGHPARNWDNGYKDDWSAPNPHVIRRFWFAVPAELTEKVRSLVPAYAGLIEVMPGRYNGVPHKVIAAPTLAMSRKLTADEKSDAISSVYHRYWGTEHDESWKIVRGAA